MSRQFDPKDSLGAKSPEEIEAYLKSIENEVEEPVCYVDEVFNDDNESLGHIVCGPHQGLPVFSSPQADREHCAAQGQPGMVKYTEDGNNDWVVIKEIHVPTQHDKEQLLMALQYLHDCYIDTDFLAVNSLVHLYQNPERIIVNG